MSFCTVFQTVIVALSARYFVDSIDNQPNYKRTKKSSCEIQCDNNYYLYPITSFMQQGVVKTQSCTPRRCRRPSLLIGSQYNHCISRKETYKTRKPRSLQKWERGILLIKGFNSTPIYLVESFSFINFVPDNYTPKQ